MSETDFPCTKINRPKINLKNKTDKNTSETLDLLEGYKDRIKPYIFTDIIIVYPKSDERFILSRIQQILSNTLLRSLYIRNGIVDAINSRNMVSIFTNLKSFMEVPALLMYLYSLIDMNITSEKLLEKFLNIVFGNKGDNQLRVGKRDAVNIMTMFEKLDAHIKKISEKAGKNKDQRMNTVMSDFYSVVCNASHPNYDAHEMVSEIDRERGLWRGLTPEEFKKRMITYASWYTPSLHMTIVMTERACQLISSHNKVDNFKNLNSPKYLK